MEKRYVFNTKESGGELTSSVKESELTDEHKQLLQGEFIKKFLDLPKDVQVDIINVLLFE